MRRRICPLLLVLSVASALALSACGGSSSKLAAAPPAAPPPAPAAAPPTEEARAAESAIRFLEDRVKRDPDDFIAYNKLAGYYLQHVRETGDVDYLELAGRAARASLKAIPAAQNPGGLQALAQVEYTSHDFVAARAHAEQLIELDPRKSYPYQLLGESLMELGDYDAAEAAFEKMEQTGGGGVNAETRLARYALLRGATDVAMRRLNTALTLALEQVPPPREAIAWCRFTMGEVAFSNGDYETAERHYRDALETFPGYFHAVAALGRVRAARGDIVGAIEQYERVVRIIPDPSFVAALGDLYKIAGRDKDAAKQYALVEQIARLGALNGALYNRQLALFYADHDLKAAEAYALAAKEYEVRRDIYGADALAWTALKAGKIPEAQAAIREALRLGTKDARLFYHAGMIARAAGDANAAREHLKRALALNPQFDPLQSPIARNTVEDLQ